MYYGTRVPGFPAHPHRGFETVTIVPVGLVDHADSLGATARYGDGDVQWLTTGAGIMHSEMFPLRDTAGGNLLDLFQIWLNLPSRNKMADPAFVILWDTEIPRHRIVNAAGLAVTVKVIAGSYTPEEPETPTLTPPPSPPHSWASDPEGDVAIWQITLETGTSLTLPPAAQPVTRRTLYFYAGDQVEIAGQKQPADRLVEVAALERLVLSNTGAETAEIVLLQGVPINEPVVAQGPFVMNTRAEIDQAQRDFDRTSFGGWPWPVRDPVHPAGQRRFAKGAGQERD